MQPDPTFPTLHGRPDHGWVNDPNGLAVIDGRYHVFFQHNPERRVHEQIRWGHASSDDLFGAAIRPTGDHLTITATTRSTRCAPPRLTRSLACRESPVMPAVGEALAEVALVCTQPARRTPISRFEF